VLQGTLFVDAGAGSNLLSVNEAASPVGDALLLTGNLILGTTTPFVLSYAATGGTFGNGIYLQLSNGDDQVNVFGTQASARTSVLSNGGNDLVVVNPLTATGGNNLAGPLAVDLGPGANQFWVSEQGAAKAGGAGSTLTLTDKTVSDPTAGFVISYAAT